MDIGALLFESTKRVVLSAISRRVSYGVESFLTRQKIESRISDSLAQVIEKLLPYLQGEHISDERLTLLIETCETELQAAVQVPQFLFASSLDGQKLFDNLYKESGLPQSMRESQLGDAFSVVFPQLANLVCIYPAAIDQWRVEGYRDTFRRLDEIAQTLGNVASKLDMIASRDSSSADSLLRRLRQSLLQRVDFQLDLTGLRGDRPDAVPLEQCYVIPEIRKLVDQEKPPPKKQIIILSTQAQILTELPRYRRVILLGAPGSGKSTFSLWFQRARLLEEPLSAAIVIRLRELVKREKLPSHQELVREEAGTHLREDITAARVEEWCKRGSLTMVLDGFDEVPQSKRNDIIAWINELDTAVENAGVILSSRPLTTDHLSKLSSWDQWSIQAFDQERITTYIQRWYAHAPVLKDRSREIDAPALASRWLSDSALKPLASSPLMLATLLMVHHMDGELPRGRSKVYARYIDGMLGLWDSRWGIPSTISINPETKKKLLTRLALHLHLAEIDQANDDEIEGLFSRLLPEVGCTQSVIHVLDYMRERTGLLVGPGSWSFVHKNVGEFLVALAINDGDSFDEQGQRIDRLRLFAERRNDRWNSVIFFWAGLASPGDLQSFIQQIIDENIVGDFELALGLIYDQLQPYRLSDEWCAPRLISLLRSGFDAGQHKSISFICNCRPKGQSLSDEEDDFANNFVARVPYTVARSIRGEIPFSDYSTTILMECVSYSKIDFSDYKNWHETIKPTAWFHFVQAAPSRRELENVLAGYPYVSTERGPAVVAYEWALSTSMFTADDALRFDEIDQAFRSVFPSLAELTPFTYLHVLVAAEHDHRKRIPLASSQSHLLAAICSVDIERVSADMLSRTRSYDFLTLSLRNGKEDLLDLAFEVIESWRSVEDLSTLCDGAMDSVARLRTRRDHSSSKSSAM